MSTEEYRVQRKISFDRDGVTLVGNLITPDACSRGKVWPARSRGVQRPLIRPPHGSG